MGTAPGWPWGEQYAPAMDVSEVLLVAKQVAEQHGIGPVQLGPSHGPEALDAVEAELGAYLPRDVRDFFADPGGVNGWEIATTVLLDRFVVNSVSLTNRLLARGSRLAPALVGPLLAGEAKAVVIGMLDAGSVSQFLRVGGYSRAQTHAVWLTVPYYQALGGDFFTWARAAAS